MQYMNCNHNITALDNVLVMYAAGDADHGVVLVDYPETSTATVVIGHKRLVEFAIESIIHECDDNAIADDDDGFILKQDIDFMNTVVGKCEYCHSNVNANGDHINLDHDPLHAFDAMHRRTYDNGGFNIWLEGVTVKVGRTGVKRHNASVSIQVKDGAADILGGGVHCGAAKHLAGTHGMALGYDVNCDKCGVRYVNRNGNDAAKVVKNAGRYGDGIEFIEKVYPTRNEQHAAKSKDDCDWGERCRYHGNR